MSGLGGIPIYVGPAERGPLETGAVEVGEDPSPWQVGRLAPVLAVDQVADSADCLGDQHCGSCQVHHPSDGNFAGAPWVEAVVHDRVYESAEPAAEEAAPKADAAVPHLERVARVIGVEAPVIGDVDEARADDPTEYGEDGNGDTVGDLTLREVPGLPVCHQPRLGGNGR